MYDIAILGDGCAAFQLLYQLAQRPDWKNQRILLIGDGQEKIRSWCFWSTEKPYAAEHLVAKSWQSLQFRSSNGEITENIDPYTYHYIPGKNFFDFFLHQFLPANPQVKYQREQVLDLEKTGNTFQISSTHGTYEAAQVYSSIHLGPRPQIGFWQHFRGWFIRTEQPEFEPHVARLMDFSIPQAGVCQFMYVLPLSATEALVEATAFSTNSWEASAYDKTIEQYLRNELQGPYTITDTEQGKIPMQQTGFGSIGRQGEIRIGTMAGMVKPSTGYAFTRMLHDSQLLAKAYPQAPTLRPNSRGRFAWYDSLLLRILLHQPEAAANIFTRLFAKQPMSRILRFLDERTNLREEAAIFSQLPIGLFLKSALQLPPFHVRKNQEAIDFQQIPIPVVYDDPQRS